MNNNKQIIERIVKLVNLIGIAGKNNIKNTSFLVLGEPITFNLSLDSNPLNGSSYFYDDYELSIRSDGKALMIKTEAIEHHDNSTYNFGTNITIKCLLKDRSEQNIISYINGWNYDAIENLETSDITYSDVINPYLFFTPSELEEIIDEFNYHISELKKKQQEDEEIVDEALSNLTKNQINILKKKLI
jgi:hypothetical protein